LTFQREIFDEVVVFFATAQAFYLDHAAIHIGVGVKQHDGALACEIAAGDVVEFARQPGRRGRLHGGDYARGAETRSWPTHCTGQEWEAEDGAACEYDHRSTM
jgi:hypothetical protein